MCTRGREARVCLQRNEAFTVSQTHTGQWLPVNESFIPVCLSPLTDTLWLWLSSAVYCLPATLQMRTSVPNSLQGKRCWSEANAMLSSWTKPRFRLLVGIFKNLRSCCVFPQSWYAVYGNEQEPVHPHTYRVSHTHTHNKNSHLPIIRFCYRLGKRLPQECPVCKWYKNFMYQKRGF